MRTPEQTLTMLLSRAVHDDGVEGDRAWETFARRYKAEGGRVFILDKEYANPLMFVVEQQEKQIERMKGTLAEVRKRAERMRRQAELISEESKVNTSWIF